MESLLEKKETYLVSVVIFPLLCLPLLFVTAGLDLSSASRNGEWTSIFSGLSGLAPSENLAVVREMGASGWLLLTGMVSLLVVMPVWVGGLVAQSFRDPERHASLSGVK
jgi:hypothetical protein